MVKRWKIVIDDPAKEYLKQALLYIKKDSPQNAEKIGKRIRDDIKNIPRYPERYPPDKDHLDNDGSYRVMTLFSFRISYYIGDNIIRIVRIRHSKQEPKEY
jgi:plasmid stabilization system protein ParE